MNNLDNYLILEMVVDLDKNIRVAAFNWLENQVNLYGDHVLDRKLLEKGFYYKEHRIPLISPQGIFKPKILDYPLSIASSPNSSYADKLIGENSILYNYRGTNPFHRDNVILRKTMELKLPLIYLYGIVPGRYLVSWPVFVIGDDPNQLVFNVSVGQESVIQNSYSQTDFVKENDDARQKYQLSIVKRRLHQSSFREKVIRAYNTQCAVCSIKHLELLDAAHIQPDREIDSRPIVNNGISLCKIHHTAFDRYILGITPDYRVEIRNDILEEIDGPMLQHGFKELHNNKILLPKTLSERPSQELLEERYTIFRNVI